MKKLIGIIFFYLAVIVCWIINLVQFIRCDFEAPFKEEIIHLIGIVVAPASLITVWF